LLYAILVSGAFTRMGETTYRRDSNSTDFEAVFVYS
jgi:hypothetical protein